MERDVKEVLASQKLILANLGRGKAQLTDEQPEAAFGRQLKQVRIWQAKQPNVKVLFVPHREAIDDPAAVALRVNGFLGGGLDAESMAGVVDGALYRQRADA